MKKLFLTYDSSSHGGEAETDEQWSSRHPEYTFVNFKLLHKEQPKDRFFYDSVDVTDEAFDKDHLFLAVIRYSTGDTFGTSHGKWHVVGCYDSYKEAEDMLAEETKPSTPGDYSHYKCWEGYFERLEGVEVHALKVV